MAGPQLALTPDLLEFAAAAESAISAWALIIQLIHTTYYGRRDEAGEEGVGAGDCLGVNVRVGGRVGVFGLSADGHRNFAAVLLLG